MSKYAKRKVYVANLRVSSHSLKKIFLEQTKIVAKDLIL